MKKLFSIILAVFMLATIMPQGVMAASSANITYDGTSVFEPQATDITATITSGSVVAGKAATDAFYRAATYATKSLHVHGYNPGDMYISFDFRFAGDSRDYIYIQPQIYNADATKNSPFTLIKISPSEGIFLAGTQLYPDTHSVLEEDQRGKTLVSADKVVKNEWHTISIDFCCLEDEIKVYFDGQYFSVPVNTQWKTDANGNTYSPLRYGTQRVDIVLYHNSKTTITDIDNLSMLLGYGSGVSSFNDNFIDATKEGGHKNHLTYLDTDVIKNAPVVTKYNNEAVSGDTITVTQGSKVSEVIALTETGAGCGKVRLYSDVAYTTALNDTDVVPNGAVMVVPAVNANGVERIYKTYKITVSSDTAEDTLYTTDEFAGLANIAKETVYNGSAPIKPMVTNDAGLTEKISGGNGGKIKQDRVYTFNYDTTPKIEQLTSIFQTQSFTDNYSEFDFKLNDDNAQLILYYNYFTTSEHSNSANAAINQFLNISSNGIKVANDTNNLTNPNVTLVDSIEPSQWHRLGVFFSNTEDEVILYYDGVKYTIPVKDGSVMLKYGARAVRWQMKGSREVANVSIDNLYLDALFSETIDYSSRIVKKPCLTSFNGASVEGEWIATAKGMTVGAFKNATQFTDATAVRIYKDASYSEDVTFNDSYVLTSASKVVLSNNEQVFAYYNIGNKAEAENTAITSTALTVDGEYIHGYGKNETVQSLVSKITIPSMASSAVYDGNTAVDASAKVKEGMILRVTSADRTESKDYTILNGELFLGNAEYTLSGVKSDATYENTNIDIAIPVINYTDDVKALSILFARYNGEKLEKTSVYEKSVAAHFDGSITQTHTDAGTYGKNVSYKVFVWEKSSIIPMVGSQLYSSALAGKKIAVFGDSISAPANGYVTMLANATGAEVINGAVGGSRVLDRADSDSFGKYKVDLQNIVDGLITTGYDWSTQESYSSATPNVLNYKNMDLSNTDAAIIWIGTNDYGTNVNIADFETAVEDVLDKLTSNYPDLKIILASPIYRARGAAGDGRHSDAYPNTQGDYLREFGEVFKTLSKDYVNVTFLDLYNTSGITKFSNEKYDYLEDGLHPYKGDNSRAYKNINAMFINELVKIIK